MKIKIRPNYKEDAQRPGSFDIKYKIGDDDWEIRRFDNVSGGSLMNEEKLGILYHEIAEVVVDIIPEEWSKVYLYGEIVEGSQTAYFYYYPEGSDKPVYSHDIPDIFRVSEHEYSEKWSQLNDLTQKLWTEFKDNDQEPWTNFTLFLASIGKFKIDFNYDDLSNADLHERKTIWKYMYLSIMPKSNSGKKHLEKYLEKVEREKNSF